MVKELSMNWAMLHLIFLKTHNQTKPVWYSAKKGKKPKQQGTLTFKITGEAQKCVFEFESRFLKVFCVQTSQTIG